MSGYDPLTGWTSFTETKWRRYVRALDDDEGDCAQDVVCNRCRRSGLWCYFGAANTLFVRCGPGALYILLSGQLSDNTDPLAPPNPATQWLSLTDIGCSVARPALPPASVLRLLREAGLLRRECGKDVPTDSATGLFLERAAEPAARYAATWKTGTRQCVWAYEVLERLRQRSA